MAEQEQTNENMGGTMIADAGAAAPAAPAAPAEAAPAAAPQEPADSLVGTVLAGRYEVMKKLGEGGMGTVYIGKHTTIGKKSAIKVLSGEFAHKQDLVDRFLQEAKAASMISQENVVEITDFGDTPDGSVFFVMEFLAGEDLSDTVKNTGPMSWERVKPIMLQICNALQAAHDAGIIHRDMKPENCFRITRGTNEDFIKVLDFGIAKVTSDEGEGKGLTRTGMIFGTPEYMSPEQAQGQKVDHRVDVYAAGVIMYELLTGRVPFTADTFMGILTKHMFEIPEAPTAVMPELQVPPEAESIILKAMQKDREYRFQSMSEMGEAIKAVGSGGAGVEVVAEEINRPQTEGHMDFKGGPMPAGVTAMPGAVSATTAPPITGPYGTVPPQKSNVGLILGAVAVVVAVVGGLVWYNGQQQQEAIAQIAEASKASRQAEADAAAEAERKAKEAAASKAATEQAKVPEQAPPPTPMDAVIKIRVTDGKGNAVNASVLDARDESTRGTANDENGFKIRQSSEAFEIILRADGYDDLRKTILPEGDREYDYEMKKTRKKTRRAKSSGSKSTTTTATTKPKPKPLPDDVKDPPKKKKKKKTYEDLLDPF